MTGPEHYLEAERLLTSGRVDPILLGQAQVHATLALAAATAMNDAVAGMPTYDYDAWDDVAGAQS